MRWRCAIPSPSSGSLTCAKKSPRAQSSAGGTPALLPGPHPHGIPDQNTQNRDSQALHVKLDELIRAKKGARNSLLDLDDLSDDELECLRKSFFQLGAKARQEQLLDTIEDEAEEIAEKR